ncbi:beta-phosphoglucomutase [Coraliomargarita sp. SDUM461003]|uniref:Beta-phosphoglucomutase n=1 Tax=Thalassobacterium maritimum TaxID=3041265 RepID=A0ABU1AQE9_9BACT|nr:beta-phosphoglucomutase [Coraliomargarita sp. SDUM461003]MDQ8206396.1 beta-phosphoglucomutase [Coraliomargarita sp. SDUM461003]
MKHSIEAVIFDLDGVIVSTDEYHYLAWKQLADEKGFSFSRQKNECLRGGSCMETLEIILGDASRDYSEADKVAMVEHQNTIYRQLLSKLQADEILPGVMDCLDQLKAQGVKVGIGSSSKDAAFILQAIGLNAVFDAVVDGSCITRSKPDPEVFTLAARQLAVEPGACLVVEDAEAGIEAALAAGMAVLAVGPAASDPRAHLKAGDLSQVTIEAMLQVRGPSAHTISAMNRYEKVDTFVESMLAQLSLEEKVSLCHAGSKFATNPVPRLNVPAFEMSDGPHGVRHEISKTRWEPAGWDDDHASYLPCGTAQAATWNRELMARCGAVLGAEARHRGKDVILGPGINLIRTPLCGRNFEYYSEDPYLTAELVVPAVRAIQAQDVAACVKHFAANNQEWNRFETDVEMDETVLRELYLPGFEAAVKEGGVATVMGAYNEFRGQCCCHNDYLVNGILKGEWGFKGAYISDWAGAKNTEESVRGGLDIEMGTDRPFEDYYLAKAFLEGIQSGKYAEAELDNKVRRVLRVMYLAGAFDPKRRPGARNTRAHQLTTLEAAREAVVLMKNEAAVLPLQALAIRKLAVIGENALVKHASGGNSSAVKTLYEVSPLEGIRKYLGDSVEVMYAKGYPDDADGLVPIPTELLYTADEGSGVKGWKAYFHQGRNFEGEATFEYAENAAYESLHDQLPGGVHGQNFSVIWETELTAPEAGTYHFGFMTDGLAELLLNGKTLCQTDCDAHRHVARANLSLEAGEVVSIQLRFAMSDNASYVKFGWRRPVDAVANTGGRSTREEALRIAKEADAVIFVGGLSHMQDIEGRDRKDLQLPDGQDALIDDLLQVAPEMVVCLISGSAVEMPWSPRAKSIVWTSYAGMEGGKALAEVLFGTVNPSGKLPFTFPNHLEELEVHQADERYRADCSRYSEGMMVGYRDYSSHGKQALFCFGHGLSYTTFELSDLREVAAEDSGEILLSLTVTNHGALAGQEVVQLYLEGRSPEHPSQMLELRGFEKVSLKPGEHKLVRFRLTPQELAHYSRSQREWVTHSEELRVRVGTSSEALPLSLSIQLPQALLL